jgi:hypothetical protein
LVLLIWLAAGCAASTATTSGSAGSRKDPRAWGQMVLEGQTKTIVPGTPVQANLLDGQYVRGFWLGLAPADGSGLEPDSPVAWLGIGNTVLLNVHFASGAPITNWTSEQVPDTFRIAVDRIEQLRVPDDLIGGPKVHEPVSLIGFLTAACAAIVLVAFFRTLGSGG